jgi:hypothetical protein
MANHDIPIENHFTLFLFRLNTQKASGWVAENVQPDHLMFGDALCVEPRYAEALADDMAGDGLVVAASR